MQTQQQPQPTQGHAQQLLDAHPTSTQQQIHKYMQGQQHQQPQVSQHHQQVNMDKNLQRNHQGMFPRISNLRNANANTSGMPESMQNVFAQNGVAQPAQTNQKIASSQGTNNSQTVALNQQQQNMINANRAGGAQFKPLSSPRNDQAKRIPQQSMQNDGGAGHMVSAQRVMYDRHTQGRQIPQNSAGMQNMEQWIADQQAQAFSQHSQNTENQQVSSFHNSQATSSNLRDSKNRIRLSSNSNTKHSSTQQNHPSSTQQQQLIQQSNQTQQQFSHSPATQTNYSSSKQYISSTTTTQNNQFMGMANGQENSSVSQGGGQQSSSLQNKSYAHTNQQSEKRLLSNGSNNTSSVVQGGGKSQGYNQFVEKYSNNSQSYNNQNQQLQGGKHHQQPNSASTHHNHQNLNQRSQVVQKEIDYLQQSQQQANQMAAQKHKSNNIFTNRDVIHQHLQQQNMGSDGTNVVDPQQQQQQYYQQQNQGGNMQIHGGIALTPQIMSSQSDKRASLKQKHLQMTQQAAAQLMQQQYANGVQQNINLNNQAGGATTTTTGNVQGEHKKDYSIENTLVDSKQHPSGQQPRAMSNHTKSSTHHQNNPQQHQSFFQKRGSSTQEGQQQQNQSNNPQLANQSQQSNYNQPNIGRQSSDPHNQNNGSSPQKMPISSQQQLFKQNTEPNPGTHQLNGGTSPQKVNSLPAQQQSNNPQQIQTQQSPQIKQQPQPGSSSQQQQQNAQGGGSQTQGGSNGQQQQQQQPKIPVICGFHKRILLITCSNQNQNNGGSANQSQQNNQGFPVGVNPNANPQALSAAQARRIRNKNPNCNHNNNSVFYQPHYNNVKYDDSHKKKEDVLRKVFFKECAKEEEKRTQVGDNMNQGNSPQPNANDPNTHLQIIQKMLSDYMFVNFQFSQQSQLSSGQCLMIELGLDRANIAHKAFLLALIRSGKVTPDNMLKVLSEVKTSATEFDNECIYCKYSQYALKESNRVITNQLKEKQKLLQEQQIMVVPPVTFTYINEHGEDMRIEHLVKMFQTQLFKKSFINTSLMIIQKKMNEKYFVKYQTANKQGQGQDPKDRDYKTGLDRKPFSKKDVKPKPKQNPPQSNLEQMAAQIQKLAKNLANPKDKEKYQELKEKYYREFLMKINKSNGSDIAFPKAVFTPYKYYIGRGNNSILVRAALKQRFWWSMGDFDEWDDYNFMWTQWKSNKILDCIKPYKEHKKDQDDKDAKASSKAGSDSLLTTQATDKESNSSVENLIQTPKKNKLGESKILLAAHNLKKGSTLNSSHNSANKIKLGIKEPEKPEKEENPTQHNSITTNHMENNFHLSNKKAIFYNMKIYCESLNIETYGILPVTFHIKEGINDKEFQKFEELYKDAQAGNATILDKYTKLGKSHWIIKPGENTNQGAGIQVSKDLNHIKDLCKNTNINGKKRSYIIQKYIEKPLLYKNRKFDIRTYTLLTTQHGNVQAYFYNEGYIRTSCREFNLKNTANRLIHLTNDAIQKRADDYGKYESGNKLTYADFQKYMDANDIKCNFVKDIVPKMKQFTAHSIKAVHRKIDPARKQCSFEIFGYDFMVDEDFNPYLIEVNTNPCLELSSPYLARLIPAMIENSIKIAIDPIFPPPPLPNSKKHQIPDAMDNKYELIFNELTDAAELKNLPLDESMIGIIEEEELEDEGTDNEDEKEEEE